MKKPIYRVRKESVSPVFHLLPHSHPHLVPELILPRLGLPCNHKPTAAEIETSASGLLPGVKRKNMQLKSKCHWFHTFLSFFSLSHNLHVQPQAFDQTHSSVSFLVTSAGTRPLFRGPCLTLAEYTQQQQQQPEGSTLCTLCHTPINRLMAYTHRGCLPTVSQCVLPGLPLLLETPDWHSQIQMPVCTKSGLTVTSDARQLSELDILNSHSNPQGPRLEKRIKWATHLQQLLNKLELSSLC